MIEIRRYLNEPGDWLVDRHGEIVGKHIEGDVFRASSKYIDGARHCISRGSPVHRGYDEQGSYKLSIEEAFRMLPEE